MSEGITDLEMQILKVIFDNSHRPASITQILKGRHIDCDQNKVVQALNALEKRDFVERFTQKTWMAKSKGQALLEKDE
ncbi:MAG: hypothetical protein ACTSUO_04065 [Candidatus Thorarchaeota archaeon]